MFYRFYDTLFADKDYAGEIQRALALGGIAQPARRVLEIGSGTGGHTLACARCGHHVVGVEVDARMVELAEQKRAALPEELHARIRYFHGRVEDLADEGFDIALALFNVVNYLGTLAALQTFLAAIAQRLRPGASLVCDAWNGVAALLDPPRDKETLVETATHTLRTMVHGRTDPMALRTVLHYTLEAQDKATARRERGTHELVQTLWPAKVIAEAAELAGLDMLGVHPLGDTSRAATDKDWKILLLARRRAER
ncbi:MAG TPA: class I SAM-dependent methyltransferase [Phycisphaerae bacterium]|nr:class I SAM-dependent methyltransferase [Phycisphaerae bacterium]